MQISRRDALMGATAAVAVAGVPTAVEAKPAAGEEEQILALFRQHNPARKEVSLMAVRAFLDTQRANEANGWTEEPPRSALPGGAPS